MHDVVLDFGVAPRISMEQAKNDLETSSKSSVNGRLNHSLRSCTGLLRRVNESSRVVFAESVFIGSMRWENNNDDWPTIAKNEIPGELLDGLERLSAGAALLEARLRWRPHLTAATGSSAKDQRLDLRRQSVLEVARALVSFAHHLRRQGGCASKWEVQLHRE